MARAKGLSRSDLILTLLRVITRRKIAGRLFRGGLADGQEKSSEI